MPSSKEYFDFISEQLSETEGISYRKMMGEYIIYYMGKVAGGIYDDRFLVKITKSSRAMMPDACEELPYDGAKQPMLQVENAEDRAFWGELFRKMYPELPERKK